jgi:hypothetical protein
MTVDRPSEPIPYIFSLPRTILIALGLTAIDILWLLKPGVESTQHALYHWSGGSRTLFLPIAIDTAITWAGLILLLLVATLSGRTRVAIWSGLLFFLPWVILQNLSMLVLDASVHQLDRALFLAALLATSLLTAFWNSAFQERFERIVGVASTVLVFAGLFGAFLLCRLAWHAREASLLTASYPSHHALSQPPIQPHRVIWIVLDELSQQQLYDGRFPGIQLPAFDVLAKQATVFTHVTTPNIYTEIVLPGLIAGKPFNDIKTSAKGELFVHQQTPDSWQAFDPHDTVFQDALNAGYGTAIAGWYNPYCHFMPSVLDKCFWTYRIENTNGMVPGESVSFNSLAAAKLLATRLFTVGPKKMQVSLMRILHIPLMRVTTTQLHIEDYKELTAHADQLLRDRSAGFVLLHMPVPHPWGIWDRNANDFTTTGSSYVNNLVLADKCLAGFRATLEQLGQWDSSTVVVMGDHGWRTKQLWRVPQIGFDWAQEDELASHAGRYDDRPAYIVKLPGQTVASRMEHPYNSVNTRKFFDAIFANQIRDTSDLEAWVNSRK